MNLQVGGLRVLKIEWFGFRVSVAGFGLDGVRAGIRLRGLWM